MELQIGDVVRITGKNRLGRIRAIFPDISRAMLVEAIRQGMYGHQQSYKLDDLEFVAHSSLKVCEQCGTTNGKHKRPCNNKKSDHHRGSKTVRFAVWKRRARKGQ